MTIYVCGYRDYVCTVGGTFSRQMENNVGVVCPVVRPSRTPYQYVFPGLEILLV
jgi:hypothetical protein